MSGLDQCDIYLGQVTLKAFGALVVFQKSSAEPSGGDALKVIPDVSAEFLLDHLQIVFAGKIGMKGVIPELEHLCGAKMFR